MVRLGVVGWSELPGSVGLLFEGESLVVDEVVFVAADEGEVGSSAKPKSCNPKGWAMWLRRRGRARRRVRQLSIRRPTPQPLMATPSARRRGGLAGRLRVASTSTRSATPSMGLACCHRGDRPPPRSGRRMRPTPPAPVPTTLRGHTDRDDRTTRPRSSATRTATTRTRRSVPSARRQQRRAITRGSADMNGRTRRTRGR